jgi:glyoxylase-like metal-dependent hydrolase (beta-lactamase superfamily II)
MSLTIPLEDNFTDVIGKAQRGLSLTEKTLAERAGVTLSQIHALKHGVVEEAALAKVAVVLGLGAKALHDLAQGHYRPTATPDLEGLALFNSVFEEMTVNSFLVWDPATREAALFDTGTDGQPMLDFAASHGLVIRQIFITHAHIDHVFDLDRLVEKTGAHAFVGEKESLEGAESFVPGRSFSLGRLTIGTRLTSGHSPGGITYVVQGLALPVAIVGDSMFAGSMGGANISYADALRNNREQILTLPDETMICPGHGPFTTVGEQKTANPFFAD